MNNLIIIFIIILVLTLIVIVTAKFVKNSSHINVDPELNKIVCPLSTEETLLVKCDDPNDVNSCNNCIGFSSCVKVEEGDKNPYVLPGTTPGTTKQVPSGNWCLPIKYNDKEIKCNPFTGYPILVKLSDDQYGWKCQCKNPSLYENSGEFGDCTSLKGCKEAGDLVCPDSVDFCKAGVSWKDDPTWNPEKGICSCPTGTYPTGDKSCKIDSCNPGGTSITNDDKRTCDCNDGYLPCPNVSFDSETNSYCNKYPMCLKDPCLPHGKWSSSSENKSCICDSNYRILLDSDTSVLGQTCIDPCFWKGNNPCIDSDGTKRGDCNLSDNPSATLVSNLYSCKNCNTKFFMPDWLQPDYKAPDYKTYCLVRKKTDGSSCDKPSECLSGNCCRKGAGQNATTCVPDRDRPASNYCHSD